MVQAAPLIAIYGKVAGTIIAIVANLAISAIIGKILAPDIDNSGRDSKGMQNVIKGNVNPRRVCYGEAVAGGQYIYLETSTEGSGDPNGFLNMIIVLTGHPIEDLEGVYVDDQYVRTAGPGGATNTSGDSPWNNGLSTSYHVDEGKYGTGDAVDHVRIIKNLGWGYADNTYVTDETTFQPSIDDRARATAINNAIRGDWSLPASLTRDSGTGIFTDPGHKVTNCAYVFLRFKFNRDVWSGFPRVKFHLKGKRLYNPALDATLVAEGADSAGTHDFNDGETWEWTDNWALCCLDYLIDSNYGIAAKTTDTDADPLEIDWEEAITAVNDAGALITNGLPSPDTANVSTYTINGIFETSTTPISNMESLLSSGAGSLIYAQGKYKLRAGVYKQPNSESDIINEDMIVSPIIIRTQTPRAELFNKVAGVYVEKGLDASPIFEPADFPIVDPLDSSGLNPYEVIDGEEIIKEVDYPFTIHEYEAQRLARIQLERVRQGLFLQFEASLEVLKFSVGDNIYLEILSNSKYASEAFFNRLGLDNAVQAQDSPLTSPYYKQFKITQMDYTDKFTIAVSLLEESQEIYDWNEGDANKVDYVLESALIVDDPTGPVLPADWVVDSPFDTVVEVVSGTDVLTLLRWSAPERGSVVNAIDIAHINSYRIEYGIVTDPSLTPANRVSTWIKAATAVADTNNVIQGPVTLTNIFIDDITSYDFRIKATTYNGRSSPWAYYSTDIGSDFSPTAIRPPPPFPLDTILEYNDLDTTQLAAGIGRYAMLTDVTDNTTGSQNNFQNTDGILINATDKNGINYRSVLADLQLNNKILYKISNSRWFLFQITDTFDIIGSGLTEAYKFDVTLLEYYDTDPTLNVVTDSPFLDVTFEVKTGLYDSTQLELLDPDFDFSTDITGPMVDISGGNPVDLDFVTDPGLSNYWVWGYQMSVGGPDPKPFSEPVFILQSGGVNTSNSIYVQQGLFDNVSSGPWTQTINFWPVHRFKATAGGFDVKIRAKNDHATLDSPEITVGLIGYDEPRGGTNVNVFTSSGHTVPANTTTYQTYNFHLEPNNKNQLGQYWTIRINLVDTDTGNGWQSAELREIEIDSISIAQTPFTFAHASVNSGTENFQGLVPQSDTVSDAGKFLKADGSWDTPSGAGNVSATPTPVDNQVAIWDSATSIEGDAGLTFDGSTLGLADNVLSRPEITDYGVTHTAPTVTANAVTVDCVNGNSFLIDMDPATATVTLTLSNPPDDGTYGEVGNSRTRHYLAGVRNLAWWRNCPNINKYR
jgi:hypothetical protein